MIYTGLHRHLYTHNAFTEKHGEHTRVCACTHTHTHTERERIYNSAEEKAYEGHSNLNPGPASIQSPDVVREKWLSLKTVQLHSRAIYFPLFGFLETRSRVLKLSTWLRMTLSF